MPPFGQNIYWLLPNIIPFPCLTLHAHTKDFLSFWEGVVSRNFYLKKITQVYFSPQHLFRNPQWVKRRFTSTLSSLAMSTLASRLPLVTWSTSLEVLTSVLLRGLKRKRLRWTRGHSSMLGCWTSWRLSVNVVSPLILPCGSLKPPGTTALLLMLLAIGTSSRTWLLVPHRQIVLSSLLTPPLVVLKLVSPRMDKPVSMHYLLSPLVWNRWFAAVTRWNLVLLQFWYPFSNCTTLWMIFN